MSAVTGGEELMPEEDNIFPIIVIPRSDYNTVGSSSVGGAWLPGPMPTPTITPSESITNRIRKGSGVSL